MQTFKTLTTSRTIPLLSSPTGHGVGGFQKEFQTLINLKTGQFSILNELWPRDDSSVSVLCSRGASSFDDTALACSCGFHGELCSHTVISGSFAVSTQ